MSAEANKELLRGYVAEVWGQGNLDALETFLAPEFRRHLSPLHEPLGRETQIERLAGFRAAFPDITITVEDVVAEDDRVAFRSVMRGTHSGEFAGIPATGKRVTVALLDVIRVENGKFAEQWGGPDVFDMLRQLGATYSPPA